MWGGEIIIYFGRKKTAGTERGGGGEPDLTCESGNAAYLHANYLTRRGKSGKAPPLRRHRARQPNTGGRRRRGEDGEARERGRERGNEAEDEADEQMDDAKRKGSNGD